MPQVVQTPVGRISFPDDMSPDDMSVAIQDHFPQLRTPDYKTGMAAFEPPKISREELQALGIEPLLAETEASMIKLGVAPQTKEQLIESARVEQLPTAAQAGREIEHAQFGIPPAITRQLEAEESGREVIDLEPKPVFEMADREQFKAAFGEKAGSWAAAIQRTAASIANGILSPEGAALFTPGGAGKAWANGFAAQMAIHAPLEARHAAEAYQRGDMDEFRERLVNAGALTLFTAGAVKAKAGEYAKTRSELLEGGPTAAEIAEKANRAAVNLSAPGTMRPTEVKAFTAPQAEAPAEFVRVPDAVKLAPKTVEALQETGTAVPAIKEIIVEEASRIEPAERNVRQDVQGGQVSFSAEAPALLREAISPEAKRPVTEDVLEQPKVVPVREPPAQAEPSATETREVTAAAENVPRGTSAAPSITKPITEGSGLQALGITPPLPQWMQRMFGPTTGPYTKGPLRRMLAQWWLGRTGPMPKEVRQIMRQMGGERSEIERRGAMLADTAKTVLESEFTAGKARETAKEQLLDYLEGRNPAAPGSAQLQQAALNARTGIDRLTQLAVLRQMVAPGKASTMIGNIGKWLRRDYEVFDPQFRRTYDELSRRRKHEPEIERVMADAESYLQKQHPAANAKEIEADMRTLLDRNELESAIVDVIEGNPEGKPSKKARINVSSLIRRKEIPPEIRALMGEIKDPFYKLKSSSRWMAQFIVKNQAQTAIRDFGLRSGILSTSPTGRNNIELFPGENPRYRPLAGAYASEQFKAALDVMERSPERMNSIIEGAVQVYLGAVNWSKRALVPLNPATWSVNALSGLFMDLGAGDFNPLVYKRGFDALFHGSRAVSPTLTGRQVQARADYLAATKGGILNESVLLGELREAAGKDVKGVTARGKAALKEFSQGAVRNGFVEIGKALREAADKPGEIFIQAPDNFFRTVRFLHEMETAKKAFPNQTLDWQLKWAAERASNTFQTYSRLPQGLRDLSRFGFLGTFVQFKLELFRNQFFNLRYAMQDLSSGNAVLAQAGAKRLAGMMAVYGAVYGLRQIFAELSDTSEEELQALQRSFTQPHDKNELLVPIDKKGHRRSYASLSYIIPQAELIKLGRAVDSTLSEPDNEKAFVQALHFVTDDYLGPGTVLQPFAEALLNARARGGKVSYKEGLEGFEERSTYAFTKPFVPGAVKMGQDLAQAITGDVGNYGKITEPADLGRKMIGIRVRALDVDKQLSYRLRDLTHRWSEASSVATIAGRRYEGKPDKIAEAKAYTDRQHEKLRLEYRQLTADAKTLGLSVPEIARAENGARIAREMRRR